MHFGLATSRVCNYSDALRGEALIPMWIPKGAAVFRGQCLFEAQRLLEEIQYSAYLPI